MSNPCAFHPFLLPKPYNFGSGHVIKEIMSSDVVSPQSPSWLSGLRGDGWITVLLKNK